MIVILDYGLGNLRSLQTALEKQGIMTRISSDPQEIASASAIFLPGVGAFRDASNALWDSGLADLLIKKSQEGTYVIGICLGMQLMYDRSFENGEYKGLGLIPGEIVKLEQMPKVPHMGWNNLTVEKEDPLTKYTSTGDFVYFVHSYYARSNGEEILAYAEYGEKIPAIVRRGNVIGFQFHPEKSSDVGARLFKALGEIIL
ncbi:imidazole glycerol phosphate synthase subunit HisH [Gudongella sp. SC589]|uniref:imidazole glycerol phosphate synthase subunit HisH n=1 Tax=Gudongella sp. SC589 TaxID=3385990 RepID=UPI003904A969